MYFTYVEVDNDDPLNVWVTVAGFEVGKHVYQTTDGGDNWTNITLDLPNLPVNCIVHRDSSYYNTIYVGTDIGVYYHNDTLPGWLPYNTDLPNVIISELDINYGENKMYAATFGRGVWKTDLLAETISDAGIKPLNPLEEVSVELYPNPNNGEFSIQITGYDGKPLSLEIIDIMGESIRSEKLNINNASFQKDFDFKLPDGMYFLKISADKYMRTVRFVVN